MARGKINPLAGRDLLEPVLPRHIGTVARSPLRVDEGGGISRREIPLCAGGRRMGRRTERGNGVAAEVFLHQVIIRQPAIVDADVPVSRCHILFDGEVDAQTRVAREEAWQLLHQPAFRQ